MSVKATSYVLENRFENPTRKLIMLVLADYADEHGQNSYPSISTIAFRAECSERAVQNHIRHLVSTGDLQIFPQASRYRTNLYRIIFKRNPDQVTPKPNPAESAPPQNNASNLHPKGANRVSKSAPKPPVPVNTSTECVSTHPRLQKILTLTASIHPSLDTGNVLEAKEKPPLNANFEYLLSLTSEKWQLLRRFCKAYHPQGSGYWKPRHRLQFFDNPAQFLSHAKNWESKQRTPPQKKTKITQTQTQPEEKPMSQEEIKEWCHNNPPTTRKHE